MKHLVQTLKWVLVVRGVVVILFGLAALFLPGLTIQLLILIFGITILVDGFVTSIGSLQSRDDVEDWWVYLLEGVFSVFLGCLTIFWPNVTGIALLVLIATWAIISGIAKMVAAIGLRKMIEGELILLFSGILSTIFGFVMLTFPKATAITFIGVIGFFALLLGVLLLTLALRIKQEHQVTTTEVKPKSINTDSAVKASTTETYTPEKPKSITKKTTNIEKSSAKTTDKPKNSSTTKKLKTKGSSKKSGK